MRLLVATWYFPTSNTIAAVRLGKLARHLSAFGHDIRVLTVADPPHPQGLPLEIPAAQVHRAPWRDVNALPGRVKATLAGALPRRGRAAATAGGAGGDGGTPEPDAARPGFPRLGQLYELLIGFPDKRIGWLPAARREGLALAREWRPDGIFASGPPFTTLLVGHLVSQATGVPLVVEFRDRWSDDPYYPPPAWRRALERRLEGRIVRRAAGITTVSEPWAAAYRARYGKPVEVVYNGFDEEDFAGLSPSGWPDPRVLRIAYTGGIYPGYRDPSPLFRAIASAPDLQGRVELHFYGTDRAPLERLARATGAEACLRVHPRVSHAEALRVQSESDVLLLMQWDDPREQGNVPGKLAEYLGARRPILVLGYDAGVPATLVRERRLGAASTDPAALAGQLRAWLAAKARTGRLPPLDPAAVADFAREEQARRLAAFLERCVGPGRAGGSAPP